MAKLAVAAQHGFSDREYEAICQALGREPNELELGLFSLNWSEHCSYKSSKRFLRRLPTVGKRVLQGPGENAGVLELENGWCVAFKVESHNHPSAVEPFNGAATGVGGIVRDILSMGARPVALLDSLRFGELSDGKSRRLFEGVVSGIAHYGNCLGVPTVGGEVYFEDTYSDNCLVNAMCVGLLKKHELKKAIALGLGNKLILAGASTGRDGIHGATFASEDLLGDSEEKRPNVQVGDPFVGKLLIEATLEAAKLPELIGLQDLGAGGLSTAPPEMAARGDVGLAIDVTKVPLRATSMSPYEIMLSESQERMVLCIKAGSEQKFIDIYRKWGLEAAVIGAVIPECVYRIQQGKKIVAEIPIPILVGGSPEPELDTRQPRYLGSISQKRVTLAKTFDLRERLLSLLRSPNIGSRRWIYQQYDHSVQTNTVINPGEGDAAMLRVKGGKFALAVTMDGNARHVYLDPYEGSKRAVCEAVHNLVAVGAEPIGITDNLNWANPTDPEVYWTFEQAIAGMSAAASALGIPFVSGNVSLYNQSEARKIYPTPVVGMVGYLKDLDKRVPMGFQKPGDLVYVVGKLDGNFGGSEFLKVFYNFVGGELEPIDLNFEKRLIEAMLSLADQKLLRSTHDVSDGGLLVAIAEMTLPKGLGAELRLQLLTEEKLFGEWPSRFVVSVSPKDKNKIESLLGNAGISFESIGPVERTTLNVNGAAISLAELKTAYESALTRFL
ncbi:phosphoribosylformylglycinamidine synthase subunit PurL [Candidatus Acetothermia bacterium]|nr:phosphoribosylformylglycinamidine synthase subunit PurL [Candidatus Acetothermia bacterium]